ncbi:MAG: hypothetical protein KDK76_03635 [Chlamydiia bacterium]|nr:hypothetical protein [Chlamydiia bacterium]
MSLSLTESPKGLSQGAQLISPHVGLRGTALGVLPTLQQIASEKLGTQCSIVDLPSMDSKTLNVVVIKEDGAEETLTLDRQDVVSKIDADQRPTLTFTESADLDTPSYLDGYSRAAAHYFTSHPTPESSLFGIEDRIVVKEGEITLKSGLSKVSRLFRWIFKRSKMEKRAEENRESIRSYVAFLEKEMGPKKLEQIQKTYGFDFREMIENGDDLLPRHVYFCNIGMNNIEYDDVLSLQEKINQDELDWSAFTYREIRGIKRLLGESPSDDQIKALDFGSLIEVLQTPPQSWERIYTGRKIQSLIVGAYNKEVTDRETFRPWVDQQELLQVFNHIKDPFPGQEVTREKLDHFFFEILTKVVVKKHLMRSDNDGNWRVGALIPSPYKDAQGKTVYYRVDQGVDSGHGKLWVTLRPADDNPSFPVIRVPRDTSVDRYTQRGGHTITRDLAADPGYHYSSTTYEEDQAFFKEFSLPIWMAHLGQTINTFKVVKESENPSFDLLNDPMVKMHSELIRDLVQQVAMSHMHPERKDQILEELNAIYEEFEKAEGIEKLIAAQRYLATVLTTAPYDADDFNRLHNLLNGTIPPPVASIGNSLGGFDAQQDFFAHTFRSRRIPITNVQVYTHSTLKINKEDDEVFTSNILHNQNLLNELNVTISIDHITEFNDIVTLATEGTLLGKGIQEREEELPVQVTLRVIEPLSNHPQITESDIHLRRFENLEEGTDYQVLEEYRKIDDYDTYSLGYKTFGQTLEYWRKKIVKWGLYLISTKVIALWRERNGSHKHIPKPLSNHKLVVECHPNGESHYNFIPVNHQKRMERILYLPFNTPCIG